MERFRSENSTLTSSLAKYSSASKIRRDCFSVHHNIGTDSFQLVKRKITLSTKVCPPLEFLPIPGTPIKTNSPLLVPYPTTGTCGTTVPLPHRLPCFMAPGTPQTAAEASVLDNESTTIAVHAYTKETILRYKPWAISLFLALALEHATRPVYLDSVLFQVEQSRTLASYRAPQCLLKCRLAREQTSKNSADFYPFDVDINSSTVQQSCKCFVRSSKPVCRLTVSCFAG
eukprot:scaffold4216_cov146-Amphora_coffeaeformis.AAC.1